MRSDESLKIKMQNCNCEAVQISDNTAVVPVLQKHLIENLSYQITASSEAFEAPQQQDPMFPLCITEPVCGWLLQEVANTCLDPCRPVCAHVNVTIQSARLNKTLHTAVIWHSSFLHSPCDP